MEPAGVNANANNSGYIVWNISNLLSLSRIVIVFPILSLLFGVGEQAHTVVFYLLLVALFTDFLDGFLARKLHQVTEFGKVLDPIADKIAVGAVGIAFVLLGYLPLWFLLLLLVRDGIILIGGIVLKKKKNIVVPSNATGKWAVAIVAFTFLLAYFHTEQTVLTLFLLISVAGLALSFTLYAKRFISLLNVH